MAAHVIVCPECARKLRVPEELARELVKCPSCGRTFTADEADGEPRDPVTETAATGGADVAAPRRREPQYEEDDYDDDWEDDDLGPRRDLEPDRGGTILTLGIVSLVVSALGLAGFCCMPLAILPIIGLIMGPIAWVMGKRDLADMRSGRRDRRGEGSTKAGRTCAIIAVAVGILAILVDVAFVVFVIVANRL